MTSVCLTIIIKRRNPKNPKSPKSGPDYSSQRSLESQATFRLSCFKLRSLVLLFLCSLSVADFFLNLFIQVFVDLQDAFNYQVSYSHQYVSVPKCVMNFGLVLYVSASSLQICTFNKENIASLATSPSKNGFHDSFNPVIAFRNNTMASGAIKTCSTAAECATPSILSQSELVPIA